MAHAAKISELTDGLVSSIAGDRSQHASFRRMREQAAKTFRNTTHARTNQFDVQSKLTGLVEKFAVLNRDDLSDALQARLEELPAESKWMPEILSLLLQLSNRPLEKTTAEDVEALSKKRADEQPDLTWEAILADDPMDDSEIWDSIERGYHSSGDDATVEGELDSDDTTSTRATTVEDDTIALARLHILQPEENLLNDFRAEENKPSFPVSELIMLRETLFMLRGLPTELYDASETSGNVTLQTTVILDTAARATVHGLLLQLANIGSSLNILRLWVRTIERTSYLQSCQAATSSLFLEFDGHLSAIEQRYAAPAEDTVVSLTKVGKEVETAATALLPLSRIVTSTTKRSKLSPFALLDELYDEMSDAETSGNDKLFGALAKVFFAGLKTYLKPLSRWIQSGLIDRNDATSMILEINADCDFANLWYERYTQRTFSDGRICCPKFMYGLAHKIFAVGKSRAFLQVLGDEEIDDTAIQDTVTPTMESLQSQINTKQLLPYSQLLDTSLEHWIAEASKDSGNLLQERLLHEHGLLQTVDRLEEVFCSKNGIQFQTFADTLFWRMDHQSQWRHNFLLSELASSTFSEVDHVHGEALIVDVNDDTQSIHSKSSIRQLRAVNLESSLSWPIQNITRERSSATHSKAFALLLQTYRARYLLRAHVLDLKSIISNADGVTSALQPALLLRQRLIVLIDILHDHITKAAHVLHVSMRKELQAAPDIDTMATVWTVYTTEMETTLLLGPKLTPIQEAIVACLELCEQFAHLWVRTVNPVACADQDSAVNSRMDGRSVTKNSLQARGDYATIRSELDESLSFIAAGARSVGRVGGNKMLEEFAARLEWMTG